MEDGLIGVSMVIVLVYVRLDQDTELDPAHHQNRREMVPIVLETLLRHRCVHFLPAVGIIYKHFHYMFYKTSQNIHIDILLYFQM